MLITYKAEHDGWSVDGFECKEWRITENDLEVRGFGSIMRRPLLGQLWFSEWINSDNALLYWSILFLTLKSPQDVKRHQNESNESTQDSVGNPAFSIYCPNNQFTPILSNKDI